MKKYRKLLFLSLWRACDCSSLALECPNRSLYVRIVHLLLRHHYLNHWIFPIVEGQSQDHVWRPRTGSEKFLRRCFRVVFAISSRLLFFEIQRLLLQQEACSLGRIGVSFLKVRIMTPFDHRISCWPVFQICQTQGDKLSNLYWLYHFHILLTLL